MEYVYALKLVWIPIVVIIVAQTIKFGLFTYKHGFNPDYLLTPGHFPSAHSAFVTSLVITIGYYDNVNSSAFAVAVAFALLTIYDAMRIRINIGIQGRVLNKLVSQLDTLEEVDKNNFPHLKERVGHYKNEVLGGIIVGAIFTTIIINLIEMTLYKF